MSERQRKSGRIIRLLPWLALALALVLNVGSQAVFGRHNTNSDMASELVLADLLNQEGRLLSDNWHYSTELRIVSSVPAFQIGLAVFPNNWHAARTLAVALLATMTAASLLFMARGLGMRGGAVWAAAAIVTPFDSIYRHLFLHGAYYTGHAIVAFLLLGLLLRLGKGKRCWVLLAALGAYAGLAGVRMLMLLGAPLLLVCTLEGYGALRRCESLRQAAKSEEATLFFGAALLTGCMLAGYLVNSGILSRIYHFHSYQNEMIQPLDLNLLGDQVTYWLAFFGFSGGKKLLSLEGVGSMLGLGIALFMPLCVAALIARRTRQTPRDRLVSGFAAAAVLLGMLLNMLTFSGSQSGVYSPSYYMVGIHLTIVAAFLLFERMPCRMEGVRQLGMAALCGVFLLEGVMCVRGMQASETNYEKMAAFLCDQGYTQGYSDFWEGNVLREASDGEIEVWLIKDYGTGEFYPWLQRADHAYREPEGRVFAVAGPNSTPPDTFAPYLLEDFYGIPVYGFESAQQFRELIREAELADGI